MSLRAVRVRRRPASGSPVLSAAPHPVLGRVWAGRGLSSPPDYQLKSLLAPNLSGMEAACAVLAEALMQDQAIVVVGDFDADGATATALAVRALRALGAKRVSWRVPDRVRHGYGLSPILVEEMFAESSHQRADVLMTVDQGISAHAGVDLAKQQGIKVVITDHHLPAETLPSADAIVNPALIGDPFPSKALAGVGVVFYVMMALRAALRQRDWFAKRAEPRLDQWLDLVALGTVADLVPLDENNRRLVHQGLQRIRAGRCTQGVRALLERAGRNLRHVTAADLGYAAAPRLNAAGRLDDMGIGVACLLSDQEAEAQALATQLSELNEARKAIQSQMQDEAEAQVAEQLAGLAEQFNGQDLAVLCITNDAWHAGVVGLVAGRLCERFQRPVVALAPAEPGSTELKGSARSPAGIHMRDLLAAVARQAPGVIDRFGGHARAAGLSLRREQLPAFEAVLAAQAALLSPQEDWLVSDGALSEQELTVEAALALEQGGPWGQGFPEPVFDGRFKVIERRVVGQHHLKLRLQPSAGGAVLDAIAFGAARRLKEDWPEALHCLYRLEINRWQGRQQLQLNVLHEVEAIEDAPAQ